MADSMQPKRLNINNNIDQSKTVLDSNETTLPGHLDIFSNKRFAREASRTAANI